MMFPTFHLPPFVHAAHHVEHGCQPLKVGGIGLDRNDAKVSQRVGQPGGAARPPIAICVNEDLPVFRRVFEGLPHLIGEEDGVGGGPILVVRVLGARRHEMQVGGNGGVVLGCLF